MVGGAGYKRAPLIMAITKGDESTTTLGDPVDVHPLTTDLAAIIVTIKVNINIARNQILAGVYWTGQHCAF